MSAIFGIIYRDGLPVAHAKRLRKEGMAWLVFGAIIFLDPPWTSKK